MKAKKSSRLSAIVSLAVVFAGFTFPHVASAKPAKSDKPAKSAKASKPAKQAKPTINVSIPYSDGAVLIVWGNVGTSDSYIVERRTGREPWSSAGSFPGYTGGIYNLSVLPDTEYSFRVRAINPTGQSKVSNTATVRTTLAVPSTTGGFSDPWQLAQLPTSPPGSGASTGGTLIVNPGGGTMNGSGTIGSGPGGGIVNVGGGILTMGNGAPLVIDGGPLADVNATVNPGTLTLGNGLSASGLIFLGTPGPVGIWQIGYGLPTFMIFNPDAAVLPGEISFLGNPTFDGSGNVLFQPGEWIYQGMVQTGSLSMVPAFYNRYVNLTP